MMLFSISCLGVRRDSGVEKETKTKELCSGSCQLHSCYISCFIVPFLTTHLLFSYASSSSIYIAEQVGHTQLHSSYSHKIPFSSSLPLLQSSSGVARATDDGICVLYQIRINCATETMQNISKISLGKEDNRSTLEAICIHRCSNRDPLQTMCHCNFCIS